MNTKPVIRTATRQPGESRADYARRHAYDYVLYHRPGAVRLASDYAHYVWIIIGKWSGEFDNWNHAIEFPAWLEDLS